MQTHEAQTRLRPEDVFELQGTVHLTRKGSCIQTVLIMHNEVLNPRRECTESRLKEIRSEIKALCEENNIDPKQLTDLGSQFLSLVRTQDIQITRENPIIGPKTYGSK
ncbi:MAG: hypothetical protein HY425_00895 [Candidatus Levybacteria bacterium]|nr:hypothetical protein [Candidatus Levybacteria bacterium]